MIALIEREKKVHKIMSCETPCMFNILYEQWVFSSFKYGGASPVCHEDQMYLEYIFFHWKSFKVLVEGFF